MVAGGDAIAVVVCNAQEIRRRDEVRAGLALSRPTVDRHVASRLLLAGALASAMGLLLRNWFRNCAGGVAAAVQVSNVGLDCVCDFTFPGLARVGCAIVA